MSTFSHSAVNQIVTALDQDFSGLLGSPVASVERIGHGSNSQVYKITDSDGKNYAGKVYFRNKQDTRERLAVEFGALTFLAGNGVECVPRVLAANREKGLTVYEYIDGRKIMPGEISRDDLDEASAFLIRLKELRAAPGSKKLFPASEAYFSLASIVENLKQRLDRLKALQKMGETYRAMEGFLRKDFGPALEGISGWVRSRLSEFGLNFEAELDWSERTLSPSDFGFHNALRLNNGKIVWLDFEYFGWDDPAKMISDFLLHPAMALDRMAGHRIAQRILAGFNEIKDLPWRLETVYPLFGLKWCLIMLNEFLPADLLRRSFASPEGFDRSELQWRQLGKARRMLERILEEYEHYPYH